MEQGIALKNKTFIVRFFDKDTGAMEHEFECATQKPEPRAESLEPGDRFNTAEYPDNIVITTIGNEICWWHPMTSFCSGTADYLNSKGGFAITFRTAKEPLHRRVRLGSKVAQDGLVWTVKSLCDIDKDVVLYYPGGRLMGETQKTVSFVFFDTHFTLADY
jgi:hypothetical protein